MSNEFTGLKEWIEELINQKIMELIPVYIQQLKQNISSHIKNEMTNIKPEYNIRLKKTSVKDLVGKDKGIGT